MQASVPTSTVDNSYEAFPMGFYDGDITGAEQRDPQNDGSWLLIKLSLDNISPKEGTSDPGRTKFSSDIVTKTDGHDVFEIADFSSQDIPFQIRRAAGLLAGLGEALGVMSREGGKVTGDLKEVASALLDGQFEGERVGFEVGHWTNKTTKETRDQFSRFGPAS